MENKGCLGTFIPAPSPLTKVRNSLPGAGVGNISTNGNFLYKRKPWALFFLHLLMLKIIHMPKSHSWGMDDGVLFGFKSQCMFKAAIFTIR